MVFSVNAQLKRSEMSVRKAPQIERLAKSATTQEMQMRTPGTAVAKAPKKSSYLEPFYRRPAGAFYSPCIAVDGNGSYTWGDDFLLLKPFKVGDYVEQGSYAGFVESIQIFNTTLRTYDARKIVVPNTELATKSLVNHFNLPQRRVAIDVGLAYGMSVEKAKEVMVRVAAENPYVVNEPKAPFATLEKFGDSSLNMRLYAWTLPENYWNAIFSLNEGIYNAFRKEGLEIPFNQMDVHLRNEA
jgi:hypothetical protein